MEKATDQVEREDAVARAVADFQAGIDRDKNFRFLFERFHRPVKGFFMPRVPAEDAFDLTQETFMGLYRGLDGFRGESELSTWLFRIADYTCRRWRRKRISAKAVDPRVADVDGRQPAARDEGQPIAVDRDRSPQEQTENAQDLQLLRQAIETLPEQMQKCLRLRIYQELRYQEIAEFMAISIQTVKAHLFQARKQLRTKLEKKFRGIDF